MGNDFPLLPKAARRGGKTTMSIPDSLQVEYIVDIVAIPGAMNSTQPLAHDLLDLFRLQRFVGQQVVGQ